jgi:class 3 adenylate cyclase/tetratricopeptide (TPR) repeat protein
MLKLVVPPEVARMDITHWLRTQGLEQYEAIFRQNDIDAEVLPTLGADDLRELGIISLGHRKKLLAAIAVLADRSSGATTPEKRQDDAASALTSAERRQLTVMFCDLVGSTALATRLDPEDLREVIGAYHRQVAKVVGRYDGFVAKYMGDGALIYFGYPNAHEDDAERAVRAGLELVRKIDNVRPRADVVLQVRIGIATGLVVVGDLIGSGESQERGVVGQTPNLAARLQALAEPNALVIADSTHRLLGELFEYDDLGAVEVKGYETPIRAWRVRGQGKAQSRYEARHAATAPTPLVGRAEEVELLFRRWQRAKGGEGQVVLVSGEPGIGKSRLVVAFQDRIQNEPHIRLRNFCSPYHHNSALYPIIAQLERAAEFRRDDNAEKRLEKLKALLAQTEVREDEVAIVADLLSIPFQLPPDLTPQRKKERTFEALLRQFEGLAHQRPLLTVFEDVHWIDPSSRELLDIMVGRVRMLPVLLIISFRPEFNAPWTGLPHVTARGLSRLDQRDGEALVLEVIKNHAGLPGELIAEIVKHTDGVPLFLEELTKAILEDGTAGTKAAAEPQAAGRSALAIPPTLQALLMARLDGLGPSAKATAQMAAALGREFSYEVLAAITPGSEAVLRSSLDRLVGAGLVFERGVPPDSTYSFKHALVQDAAYSTLLRTQRQTLHGRIAMRLKERFAEKTESQPELLARHLTEAGLTEEAITYWSRAGQQAAARFANKEAESHFTRAIELLENLPPSRSRDELEVDLRLSLAVPQTAVHGYGSAAVETCALRVRQLCDELDDHPGRFAAYRLMWNSFLMRKPVPRSVRLGRELLAIARDGRDCAQLAVAQRALGYSLFMAGKPAEADALFAECASLADSVPDTAFSVYGEHPGMISRLYGGGTRCLIGFPEQGAMLSDAGVAHARARHSPHNVAWALVNCGSLRIILRDTIQAERLLREILDLAQAHRFPQWLALGNMLLGKVLCSKGDSQTGIRLQKEGMLSWQATGAVSMTTRYRMYLAESLVGFGQLDEARSYLAEAHSHRERFGEEVYAAELERVEAQLLRAEGAPEQKVEFHLNEAIRIARGQVARLFELRAATDLARLWREEDRRAEAHALLSPICGWFTEGFGMPDLQEANALLHELR